MKLSKERNAINTFCEKYDVQYEIDDGELHITTANGDWRIIVNGKAKKLFLYHKNGYIKREAIPSIVPGYHSQAIHCSTILQYLEYIVDHDAFRAREAKRNAKKANSRKELRRNTHHIRKEKTNRHFNSGQLYSLLSNCEF